VDASNRRAASAPSSAVLRQPEPALLKKESDARQRLAPRVRNRVATRDHSVAVRFEMLLEIVSSLGSCVLALSGGIDSSLLLAVAAPLLRDRCLAVTAESVALPAWDRTDARVAANLAREHGTRWRAIETREIDDPRYASNTRARCYFCKLDVYGALVELTRSEGYAWLIDGANASDVLRDDRPGMAAGKELGVRSPLAEAGITKADVRILARALDLPDPDRPSSACLASRIPFGEVITPQRLRRVETAELALRSLGFRQVRVRDFGTRARVEVDPADVTIVALHRPFIDARLGDLGFAEWEAQPYAGTGAGDSANETS
jgi:pyridinium-3,5-biscarboxylic acid mononucleotide sulfurtransferase